MFNIFFRKKEKPARTYRKVVWGIWVSPKLKADYLGLARQLNVPIGVLAGYVLRQWLLKNGEILLNDIVKQGQFRSFLVYRYLRKSEDEN